VPVYIIADIQVTDPAAYEPYRPLAAASIARFGGRFTVRGGPVELLEGGPQPESGSWSSNSRTRRRPAAGTIRRNIRAR
jgi:Domain of unknown function (DUF1330)